MNYKLPASAFFFAAFLAFSAAKQNGAPERACPDMTPQHGGNTPSRDPAPYILTAEKLANAPGEWKITVKSATSAPFKGFMVQARKAGGTPDDLIGSFQYDPRIDVLFRHVGCPANEEATITHVNKDLKKSVTAVWKEPPNFRGNVEFKASVAKDFANFWVGLTPTTASGASEAKVIPAFTLLFGLLIKYLA